jgi:uncharacterized membrane protein YfcA
LADTLFSNTETLAKSYSDILGEAWVARKKVKNTRSYKAIGISVLITLLWLLGMAYYDLWSRVFCQWPASLTMVFGSIVAGSTPQGGGAIAFPVFTKVLDIPTEIARTFSLSIQAIGMTAASLSIIINRRPVEWRTVLITSVSAIFGFLLVGYLASNSEAPFRPSLFPGEYVKVTFTIVLTAMAFVVYTGTRVSLREVHRVLPPLNRQMFTTLLIIGFLGGVTSSLVGSGSDVFVYLGLVVFFTIDPKVGVPTSVVCMAIISLLGLAFLGVFDMQLFVGLNEVGDVTSVAKRPVTLDSIGNLIYASGDGASASRFDLLGLLLAAVPIVCWGAPFGSWLASQLSTRNLVRFVTFLAITEIVSTAIFLEALHTDMALLSYAIIGTIVSLVSLHLIAKNRNRLFKLPELNFDQSVNSERIDLSDSFHRKNNSVSS